jgi:hypothetical protein
MGIYADRTTVSEAIGVLHKAGYRAADISVLSSESQSSKDFAHVKHAKGLAGAGTGAAAGGGLGAALGWLISIQVLNITALSSPLAAAGPVLAALAGAGACGAVGWIAGLLVGLGMTEYVARRYAGRTRRGGILLSVHCDSPEWRQRAAKTLKDTGARDISSCAEAKADFGATDRPTERPSPIVLERVAATSTELPEYAVHEIEKP